MTLTPITTYPVNGATSTGAALATPSFTPAVGELLIVKCVSESSASAFTAPSDGVNTYTSVTSDYTGSHTGQEIWSTIVGSSVPLTVSGAATTTNKWKSMTVERWPVGSTLGAVMTAARGSGAPSGTITTTGAGSAVSWCDGDWAAVAPGTPSYLASATSDGLHDKSGTGSYVAYYAYQQAATPGAQNLGMTTPTGQTWTLLGLEILAGGGTPVSETTDPAALAWSGTNATIKSGIAAAGKAAAAAWSGTEAATKIGVTTVLATGALAWAGTQASIVTGVHAPTDPAAAAWGGTNVATKIGVVEQADPAALAWTGVAPSLDIATVLDVGGMPSLAWAGTNATVTGSGVPPTNEPVTPAATTWAGTEATLKAGVNTRANPAGLVWAGTQARTRVDTPETTDPAALAWSGTNTRTSIGSTTGTQPAAAVWAGTVATIRATADLAIPGNPAGLSWAGTNVAITGAVPNRTRNITITISLITGGWSAAPASGGWSTATAPISGWGTDTPNGGWAADSITA